MVIQANYIFNFTGSRLTSPIRSTCNDGKIFLAHQISFLSLKQCHQRTLLNRVDLKDARKQEDS